MRTPTEENAQREEIREYVVEHVRCFRCIPLEVVVYGFKNDVLKQIKEETHG